MLFIRNRSRKQTEAQMYVQEYSVGLSEYIPAEYGFLQHNNCVDHSAKSTTDFCPNDGSSCVPLNSWNTSISPNGVISLKTVALFYIHVKDHPRPGYEGPEEKVQLYSFFNLGTRWGWVGGWSMPRPDRFTSVKGTQ
jgi:hypothetical protein